VFFRWSHEEPGPDAATLVVQFVAAEDGERTVVRLPLTGLRVQRAP
jgi:hypothetical protein